MLTTIACLLVPADPNTTMASVQNMKTGTLRPIEPSPRSADPHKYVRLNLITSNSSSSSSSKSKQKRLALRNIVAHCWLPKFSLTADGMLIGPLRVFPLNMSG
jgi:hypothetical protein